MNHQRHISISYNQPALLCDSIIILALWFSNRAIPHTINQ